jgi:hypothetical protein
MPTGSIPCRARRSQPRSSLGPSLSCRPAQAMPLRPAGVFNPLLQQLLPVTERHTGYAVQPDRRRWQLRDRGLPRRWADDSAGSFTSVGTARNALSIQRSAEALGPTAERARTPSIPTTTRATPGTLPPPATRTRSSRTTSPAAGPMPAALQPDVGSDLLEAGDRHGDELLQRQSQGGLGAVHLLAVHAGGERPLL